MVFHDYKGEFLFLFFLELYFLLFFSQRFLSKTWWFIKALSFGFEDPALKITAGFSQISDHSNKLSSWVIPEEELGSMTINNREVELNRWRTLKRRKLPLNWQAS